MPVSRTYGRIQTTYPYLDLLSNLLQWLLVIASFVLVSQLLAPTEVKNQRPPPDTKWASQEAMIINEIRQQGGTEEHLRIAECESQYGKYPYNWEGSSAKGVYMFTDKTWEHYCEGDVLNYKDNIKCFIKLYLQHKSWWACTKNL